MKFPLSLLGGLFNLAVAASFDIPNGCLVRNTIHEEAIISNEFEFLMLQSNGKDLGAQILITCDSRNFDELNLLTPPEVAMVRHRSQTSSWNLTYTAQGETKDWKRFHLGLVENLSLVDEDGKDWLPRNIPINCPIKSVTVKNGIFIRHCPQEIPTWMVDAYNLPQVPLLTKIQRQRLSLISRRAFSPVFTVCGTEIQLGVANGNMVTGDSVEPFPAGHQQLSIEIYNVSSAYILKLLTGEGKMITSTPLKDLPTKLSVNGRRNNDSFTLVQHLRAKTETQDYALMAPRPTEVTENKITFLFAIQAIVILILMVQLTGLFMVLKCY